MKNLFLLSCLFVLGSSISFAQKKTEVSSEIKNVTVYLSGAEVTRKATVNVPVGMSDIVFTNLTTDINANTIQVSSTGDFVIMGATFQLNYLASKEEVAGEKIISDSIEILRLAIGQINNAKEVNEGLVNILNKNESVGGNNIGVTLANLQAVYEYYALKMAQLKAEWTELDEKQKKLQSRSTKLTQQLYELNNKKNQPTGEIVVQVSAKVGVTGNFTLSYIVNNAGWNPNYDIRCKSINEPVKLTYKADVHQNTNEDWKNVKLKLSTANPTVSAQAPVLQPWYLYYYNAYNYGYNSDFKSNMNFNNSIQQAPSAAYGGNRGVLGTVTEDKDAQTTSYYTTVNTQQLSVEFDIDIPYDIPSDNKIHKVSIQDYEVPATYQYFAVPKLDNDAFLLARITDWSKLNLLSGNANIFFEGAYVGQSYINTVSTKDTLDLSLGRDKKIIIKRQKERDYTKEKIIGSDIKQSFNYTIIVRNTKAENITIKIYDQFPISNNEQIKVFQDDAGTASINPISSKLTWVLTMKPNEEQRLKFSFTVQYPKEQTIEGL